MADNQGNMTQVDELETKVELKPDATGQPQVTKTTVKTKTAKTSAIPPLVDIKITNPITYLKAWWKKVVGNEGIKLTLQIKPLTAIALTLIVTGVGFGLGRLTIPQPLVQYVPYLVQPTLGPSPTVSPWRETAFSGKLQVSGTRYFLVTTSAEAITLDVPSSIDLSKLVGKRIMAVGNYNKNTRTLVVSDATDLEVLPAIPVPIPTTLSVVTNLLSEPTPPTSPTP